MQRKKFKGTRKESINRTSSPVHRLLESSVRLHSSFLLPFAFCLCTYSNERGHGKQEDDNEQKGAEHSCRWKRGDSAICPHQIPLRLAVGRRRHTRREV